MTEPAFLLDANICIYVLTDARGQSAQRVAARDMGQVVTSSIAYAEVMRGIPADEQIATDKAHQLFGLIEPLPFDRAAADAYRRMPFKRGSFDRLIAAHALALGLILVTNNERDFADIPDLKVENWTV